MRDGGTRKANERRLVQLASRQFDVVTARDFCACRVSRQWLRRRIETGEWIQIHRAVFKLGSNIPNLDQLEMAAILAAGDGAVLSHTSAAGRLGLDVPRSETVQITIPASRRVTELYGVRLWRSKSLHEKDITKRGPFRLTHLARTMIDLAAVLDDAWLRIAFDSALRQRRTNLAWISRALSTHRKCWRGADRLRALVDEYQFEDEVPDSVLESLGVELALATGRQPKRHWNVFDGKQLIAEVDLAWPEVRLGVEFDGWKQHGSRSAFFRDRARDRAAHSFGWVILRYTWRDVTGDRESMIAQLRRAYESRALLVRSATANPTGRGPPEALGYSEQEA